MGKKPRIIGLLAVAFAATAFGILRPVAGSASPSKTAATLAAASFTDATGDSAGGGPDVTSVSVSDDSAGKITFSATIANRPELTDVDAVQAFFDTDRNARTGGYAGAEYDVGWIQGHQVLMHWDGTQFAIVSPAGFSGSYKDGKAGFTVSKSDLGGATTFNLVLTTTGDGGNSISDRAPNGTAVWSYPNGGSSSPPSGTPPPPPPPGNSTKLKASKLSVGTPHSGRRFTVSMVVSDASSGAAVKSSVICTAKVSGKPLRETAKASAKNGKAACVWTLPTRSAGKPVKGSITAAYQGVKVSRSFSARIRA